MQTNFVLTEENKDLFIALLKEGTVKIVFEKKDGAMREMLCTLKHSIIAEHWISAEAQRKFVDSVLPVFDLEAKAWRSFRWESLKTYDMDF
jgi:hypothetical protein